LENLEGLKDTSSISDFILMIRQQKLFSYLCVAFVGFVTDLMVYAFLVYMADVDYMIASIPSFFVSTFVNYVLSIIFVFKSNIKFSRSREIFYIYLVSGIGLVWHQLFLYISVDIIELHIMAGKILSLGLVFFWNYLIRRMFIFSSTDK